MVRRTGGAWCAIGPKIATNRKLVAIFHEATAGGFDRTGDGSRQNHSGDSRVQRFVRKRWHAQSVTAAVATINAILSK
ncbi:MAG: hypothetical protein ABIR08_11580 [Sphingomonas sp.]